jgi:hypothetical protein
MFGSSCNRKVQENKPHYSKGKGNGYPVTCHKGTERRQSSALEGECRLSTSRPEMDGHGKSRLHRGSKHGSFNSLRACTAPVLSPLYCSNGKAILPCNLIQNDSISHCRLRLLDCFFSSTFGYVGAITDTTQQTNICLGTHRQTYVVILIRHVCCTDL